MFILAISINTIFSMQLHEYLNVNLFKSQNTTDMKQIIPVQNTIKQKLINGKDFQSQIKQMEKQNYQNKPTNYKGFSNIVNKFKKSNIQQQKYYQSQYLIKYNNNEQFKPNSNQQSELVVFDTIHNTLKKNKNRMTDEYIQELMNNDYYKDQNFYDPNDIIVDDQMTIDREKY